MVCVRHVDRAKEGVRRSLQGRKPDWAAVVPELGTGLEKVMRIGWAGLEEGEDVFYWMCMLSSMGDDV